MSWAYIAAGGGADIKDHVSRTHILDLEHGRRSVFFQRWADNDVDGSGMARAAPFLASSMIPLAADSTRSGLYRDLPTSYPAAFRKGIGDTAAHDELVHALERLFRTSSLVENLGTADDGKQRMLGRMEDTGHGFEFGGHEQAHAGDLGETDGPFGGSLRAVRRGERIHDVHTPPSAASLRATRSLFFFSPLLKRTFSHRTHSPGFTLTPSR